MTMFGEALNCRQNCIPSALYLFFVRLFKIRSCVQFNFSWATKHQRKQISHNLFPSSLFFQIGDLWIYLFDGLLEFLKYVAML